MLKEQGPQTDFSGTLKGLSRSGLFAFIPSAGLWSAYYIMSRRLRLCVHSGWAVRGIMRCLSLFCQGMFVRSRIHRGRKAAPFFFFLQRAGVDVPPLSAGQTHHRRREKNLTSPSERLCLTYMGSACPEGILRLSLLSHIFCNDPWNVVIILFSSTDVCHVILQYLRLAHYTTHLWITSWS